MPVLARRTHRAGRTHAGRVAVGLVSAIVVALLAGGVQHSLRLCAPSGHRTGSDVAAAPAGCPEHAGKRAAPAPPQSGGTPACCAPIASLVSIPSARGTGAVEGERDAAPAIRLPAWASPVALDPGTALASRSESAREALARPGIRFAQLRPHLALGVILA